MLRLNFDPGSRRDNCPDAQHGSASNIAAKQLALDEAMLVWADQVAEKTGDPIHDSTELSSESFRVWSFDRPTVVLGRSSKWQTEVNQDECRRRRIPVLRRCTGGASIVAGPGCLMYSVVLRLRDDRSLRKIDAAHDFVMGHVLAAVRRQCPSARRQGVCDLTIGDRKFSGNSLRISRHHLLYHGTLLTDADLNSIAACLDFAPRQPDYRRARSHRDFIVNVPLDWKQFADDLAERWDATAAEQSDHAVIQEVADELLASRYLNKAWHLRH